MRILLFFDLPTVTAAERSIANSFRKDIIKEGFFMLQESVYCKLVLNTTVLEGVKNRLEKLKPKEGSVMLLTVTEKQFSTMQILVGDHKHTVIDKDDRLVIL